MKNTKKASNRVFYKSPRKWLVTQWLFTPAALVLFLLSTFLSFALVYGR